MKAKDLKDILSGIDDDAEILFDRYDHFLDEYECYDYRSLFQPGENQYMIELKRKAEDDDQTVESIPPSNDDDEEEELKTSEMLDDMMDADFVAAL